MKKLKKKVLIVPFLAVAVASVIASSHLTSLPKFVNQPENTTCRMEKLDESDHLKLHCPEYIEDVYLQGNFSPNAKQFYYCHNIMGLILFHKNVLTLCLQKTVHFPIYLDCEPTELARFNRSCHYVYNYVKEIYTPTISSSSKATTTMLETTTTVPPTLISTPEAITKNCESWDINSMAVGAGILLGLEVLIALGFLFKHYCECCHLKSQEAKKPDNNGYELTPLGSGDAPRNN